MNQHSPYSITEKSVKLHNSLTIVDWHSDSLLWNRNLLKRSDYGHVDIPRLREGNVAIQMFTVVTKSPADQNYMSNKADSDNITALAIIQLWPLASWNSLLERALFQATKLHNYAKEAPGQFKIIRNQSDLHNALKKRNIDKVQGKSRLTMGMLGLEGAHALEGNLNNIRKLYEAGYRMIGLHHFFDNKLGGSHHGVSQQGLTDFGRAVILELNKYNIIIDISHSSQKVVDDVLKLSKKPVVISHTGVKGICKSYRNLSDWQIKKIALKGGLIGIGYWRGAVCDISPEGIIKSIRYAINLVGIDHVSLGSDFDGSTTVDFDTSELPVLTQQMLENGFTETEIRKVMGENALRFLAKYLPD